MNMDFNLNDRATVTLTEKGRAIWREHWKDNPYAKDRDSTEVSVSLWELAQIFGPHLYLGCAAPFVDNTITIATQ